MYQDPRDLRQDDAGVRQAVRFGLAAALVGMGFLVMAAVWMSTCAGATADTAACGTPQRTLLALGGPAILFVAGVWAFARTYQAWRRRETYWAWQGAGWLLMTLLVLALVMSVPVFGGTVVAHD